MNQEQPTYSIDEFERESRHIDNLVWDAIAVREGDRVLFCGYGEDASWIRRAIRAGALVSVVEHREKPIEEHADLDAALLRGSTSVIPAGTDTFDLAVAYHYLHEADPFFHAQIVSELARVAQRVAIVEPGPPADPLGKQIASLYSQAKRELGQFEYYQPLEYWRKLLKAVKADVAQHVFAFAKVPPHEYLRDTIALLLRTMEVEETPRAYLDELRALTRRSDSLLLPPPRYVIVGAPVGDLRAPAFTPREEAPAVPVEARIPAKPQTPPAPTPTPPPIPAAPVAEPARIPQPQPGPPPAAPGPFGIGWHWEPPESDSETEP